jgi:hypothetical protein
LDAVRLPQFPAPSSSMPPSPRPPPCCHPRRVHVVTAVRLAFTATFGNHFPAPPTPSSSRSSTIAVLLLLPHRHHHPAPPPPSATHPGPSRRLLDRLHHRHQCRHAQELHRLPDRHCSIRNHAILPAVTATASTYINSANPLPLSIPLPL